MNFNETLQKLINNQRDVGLTYNQRVTWIPFAHHFTDIQNAVSILKMGKLISRNRARQLGLMKNDNASSEVIEGTDNGVADLVRLYFRPRTPTQFRNEGFQTRQEQGTLQANCPVPVFFLFDLNPLLERPQTSFTDRSLALHQRVARYSTPEEFSQLPFEKIYHNQPVLSSAERNDIIPRRHAEIVIPNELDLQDLKWILVRSLAEKQTLLTLLHQEAIYQYDAKIRIGHGNFFFRNRNYIEDVNLTQDEVDIRANTNNAYPSDWGTKTLYAVNPEVTDKYLSLRVKTFFPDSQQTIFWPENSQEALLNDRLQLQFNPDIPKKLREHYVVTVTLNEHIAYQWEYQKSQNMDVPF